MNPQQNSSNGISDTILNKVYELAARFDLSLQKIIYILTYLGIGLLAGFAMRRFGTFIIMALLGCAALVWGFSYIDIISINSIKVQEMLGMTSPLSCEGLFQLGYAWMKTHVAHAVSIGVGFFLGYRFG